MKKEDVSVEVTDGHLELSGQRSHETEEEHFRSGQPGQPGGVSRFRRRFPMAAPAPRDAVSFEHVGLSFGDVTVLRDVSFTIPDGDMAILIGPSGAGKSVVLKLALGLLQPDAGRIRIHGQRIDDLPERALIPVRDEVGMMFQEGALFDSLSVGENVGFKLEDQRCMGRDAVRARVAEVLGFVGLTPFVDRLPAELSGGQRRRVALARALAASPRLLLLDDPTAGLDPITAKTVDAEIVKVRDLERVTSLIVTHQLQDAFFIATHEARLDPQGGVVITPRTRSAGGAAHVLLLRDGAIRFDGPLAGLLASRDPYVQTYLSGWVPPLSLETPHAVA